MSATTASKKNIGLRDNQFVLRTMTTLLQWTPELGYTDRTAVIFAAVKKQIENVYGKSILDQIMKGEIKIVNEDVTEYEKYRDLIQTAEAGH